MLLTVCGVLGWAVLDCLTVDQVWAEEEWVLKSRMETASCEQARRARAPRAQALAQYLVNLNVWTHNILTLVARRRAGLSAAGGSLCDVRTACDHARVPWALVSAGVVAYSCAVALTLPFFSTLVGLMSSVTYLTCAYTLPVRGGPKRGGASGYRVFYVDPLP